MARARNIKPAFFMNEDLAEIAPLGRLLFIGLWCAADREGRLEDRPKRLAAEILPYDDADVDELLQDLHVRGFILRYQAGDLRFIQVVNFAKHQNPHHQERESRIPAPDTIATRVERTRGRPSTSPELISDKSRASSEAIVLIPDSLIPDSLKKEMSGKPDPAAKPGAGHAGTKAQCAELLAHLNAKAGKKFQPVDANVRLLAARLKEATAEEIRAVIDAKVAEWGNTEMAKYLRPETLFNATKFAGYLGQIGAPGGSANNPTTWWARAGFATEGDAADAGCWQSNWREFQGGQRAEVSA